jgi:hypothetical protein
MEWFIDTFVPIATFVISCVSLLLLFAIAGTLAKLLKYLGEEGEGVPLMREDGDLMQGPDYVDQEVLRGRGEPHSDGVNDRPTSRNWDGVSPQ